MAEDIAPAYRIPFVSFLIDATKASQAAASARSAVVTSPH